MAEGFTHRERAIPPLRESKAVQQWVAMIYESEIGVDSPIRRADGAPAIWIARDRTGALAQIRAALSPERFASCVVISLDDRAP
jgi:hypothetical protein